MARRESRGFASFLRHAGPRAPRHTIGPAADVATATRSPRRFAAPARGQDVQLPPCSGEFSHTRSRNASEISEVSAASRPVRRILFGPRSAVTIHLGRRSPDGSSGLPGVVGRAVLPLLGLAPGGACRATRVTPGAGALLPHRFTLTCAPVARRHRRSALCCAVLRVAPTGGYPAPCPVESGRSSNQSRWSAATRPTRCAVQSKAARDWS